MENINEEKKAKVIREVLDGKEVAKLDVVDEFMDIEDDLYKLDYEMDTEPYDDDGNIDEEIFYSLLDERKQLCSRRDELGDMVDNWAKDASVMEKLSVIAVSMNGAQRYDASPVGARYREIINDSEVQSNNELMRKLNIFKEKCFVITDATNISLDGEYKGDEFICKSISGAQELAGSNARVGFINFETGEIINRRDSKNEDWIVDEHYVDESIISIENSKLAEKEKELLSLEKEEKTISETENLIEQKENKGQSIGE